MTTTRSAARQSASPEAKKPAPEQTSPKRSGRGAKRVSDSPTPAAKRGKMDAHNKEKIQTSIEDTLLHKVDEKPDEDGKDAGDADTGNDDAHAKPDAEGGKSQADDANDNGDDGDGGGGDKQLETGPAAAAAAVANDKKEEQGKEDTSGDQASSAVVEDAERAEAVPSTILEKGIVYFFFRARVGMDEPQGVEDVARGYIVLRPLPLGAKLGEGALEDMGNNRLLALPKKTLPREPRDRFMTFVEKANTTLQELKDTFMAGEDYQTKTAGTRHTPAATPSGEGVYTITSTGRSSHFSYILTLPAEINEVQEELGLGKRASFVASVKNPKVGGPAYARLPQGADFSQEIMDEFRGRGWMPLQPKLLDYANAQLLLIGEKTGAISDAAVEQSTRDRKRDKETPLEEMEKLESEDEQRLQHLKGDDPVLLDLGLSSQEHEKLQTTW